MWGVFAVVVVAFVFGGAVAFRSASLERIEEERRLAARAACWAEPAPAVLSHIAADGELIEFPIIRGESLVSLATTLGEIASLPEVVA